MVQLTAADVQKPCGFYHVKLLQHASSRFTTISIGLVANGCLSSKYKSVILQRNWSVIRHCLSPAPKNTSKDFILTSFDLVRK